MLKRYFFLLATFYCDVGWAQMSEDFWILTNPEAPFVQIDDKRQLSGYAVDVVNGVLAHANIHQQILTAPWPRVEKEAREKANVLVFALARTPEREAHYHWITPITANVLSVFVNGSSPLASSAPNDLTAFRRVAVLENDVRHHILQRAGTNSIMTFPDWQKALSSVIEKNSDAIFFSDAGLAFYCSLDENDCSKLQRAMIYQKTESFLVLSKPGTDLALATRLKTAAKEYKQSVEYHQISQRWLAQYRKEVPIPMHLDNGTLNLWQQ